jgi:signal transduction histidine kinase
MPAEAGWTSIAVRDSGQGVSAEKMDKLFQPFNRLGLESAPIEGTGIGLTIALKLAEQMGGRLEASSEPGVGSEFRLTLRAGGAVSLHRSVLPDADIA